ncbi:hypothetical protein N665_1089s0016 [Sinapis alba]|nr:hypothetical protein N665_1089s0016 [Sinapis alba]
MGCHTQQIAYRRPPLTMEWGRYDPVCTLQNYTNVWEDIIPLLTKKRSKVDMFLFRYVFQAVLYAIWKERNGRRFGEDQNHASGIIKLVDKQVRNRISSMDHRCNSDYKGVMATWFSLR